VASATTMTAPSSAGTIQSRREPDSRNSGRSVKACGHFQCAPSVTRLTTLSPTGPRSLSSRSPRTQTASADRRPMAARAGYHHDVTQQHDRRPPQARLAAPGGQVAGVNFRASRGWASFGGRYELSREVPRTGSKAQR
jgi:hypothetical protein